MFGEDRGVLPPNQGQQAGFAYRAPQLMVNTWPMDTSRDANPAVDKYRADDRSAGRTRARPASLLSLAALAAAAFLIAGFVGFAAQVAGQDRYLDSTATADGIVVLTGGRARLDAGVALLRAERGARLLISGVDAGISEETLRRTLGVSADLFECCIDVDREALDTTGNARSSAAWATHNGYLSLIVVTNDYHVPRSMLEMRRVMPGRQLTAYPVINENPRSADMAGAVDRYRVLIGEYAKYLVAQARVFPSDR